MENVENKAPEHIITQYPTLPITVPEGKNWVYIEDDHILTILRWITILGDLSIEICLSEMDDELHVEIGNIINRLTQEVGVRMVNANRKFL